MNHRRYQPQKETKPSSTPQPKNVRWATLVLACLIYFFVSSSLWVFHGPFGLVRNYVIDTFDETRHGYLLRPLSLYTLSNSVIQSHSLADSGMLSETLPISLFGGKDYNNDGAIHLYTYHGTTFTAHIMVVDNPKRIQVVATKYIGKTGQTVQEMVEESGAVAGVNGGAFSDNNQQGTGANPLGITIHDGQC